MRMVTIFGRKPADPQAQVELAKQLYRFQNFKSSVIPQKVESDVYQSSSVVAFYSIMRRYLYTGHKDLQRALPIFLSILPVDILPRKVAFFTCAIAVMKSSSSL